MARRTLANDALDAFSSVTTSATCSFKRGLAIIVVKSASPSEVRNSSLTTALPVHIKHINTKEPACMVDGMDNLFWQPTKKA
jgi:hypothetical protein